MHSAGPCATVGAVEFIQPQQYTDQVVVVARLAKLKRGWYLQFRAGKILSWTAAAILSLLIIASHKHYTVDVTVAWYTVPLVFYTLERRWTTRRGDTKVDNSDSQMKSLREVLVREVGGTHQDNSGPVEASEAPSTAGYAGVWTTVPSFLLFCSQPVCQPVWRGYLALLPSPHSIQCLTATTIDHFHSSAQSTTFRFWGAFSE